jgi:hypothetical protein
MVPFQGQALGRKQRRKSRALCIPAEATLTSFLFKEIWTQKLGEPTERLRGAVRNGQARPLNLLRVMPAKESEAR